MWVTKLLIFPVEIRIFCPKTTKFGPKLAFLVNLGQAMQAYSMPCCGSVGGCGARAVSRKTPIYFIISMFTREQDPASLASADFARSAAEKTADEEVISASLRQSSPKLHVGDLQALARARRQEAEKAKARAKMAATSRHSR